LCIESLGQKRHASGLDRKSLTELLGFAASHPSPCVAVLSVLLFERQVVVVIIVAVTFGDISRELKRATSTIWPEKPGIFTLESMERLPVAAHSNGVFKVFIPRLSTVLV